MSKSLFSAFVKEKYAVSPELSSEGTPVRSPARPEIARVVERHTARTPSTNFACACAALCCAFTSALRSLCDVATRQCRMR